jgi:hypothetical protein
MGQQHGAQILKNDLGVKETYQHTPKRVTLGGSIETNRPVLKWYALSRGFSKRLTAQRPTFNVEIQRNIWSAAAEERCLMSPRDENRCASLAGRSLRRRGVKKGRK